MILTKEERKELLAKREYYRDHPEEAIKLMVLKDDGYMPVCKKTIKAKEHKEEK